MSKKLIAVASAAALALSALVGVAPASATAPTIALDVTAFVDGAQTGATAALANTVLVPAENKIIHDSASSAPGTDDTVRAVNLTNLLAEDVINITTTGGVEVLSATTGLTVASEAWNVTDFGKTSVSVTVPTGGTADVFYFYTTSTAVGTAVINVTRAGGTSITSTYHFKGIAGKAYNLTVSDVPATLANTKTANISWKVTDVFGNNVTTAVAVSDDFTDASAGNPRVVLPATVGMRPGASAYYNATTASYEGTITSASSGATVFGISIDQLATADLQDPDVDGLPEAVNTFETIINSPGVSSQVATLTAQVAALQVIVDRKVTKKRYNTLARKWNRAFPSQKVWVKP